MFVLESSYYEIIYRYTQFLFLKSSQIGKELLLEDNKYKNYENEKP